MSVSNFLEQLEALNPTKKSFTSFKDRGGLEKIYLAASINHGRYSYIPYPNGVTGFTMMSLWNTREVKMPRKTIASDGTENIYEAWIKILPANAYVMKDPESGRVVSTLSSSDEELLNTVIELHKQLAEEVDLRTNVVSAPVSAFLRIRNYVLFGGYCTNVWKGDSRVPTRTNFPALFICTSRSIIEEYKAAVNNTIFEENSEDWMDDLFNNSDLEHRNSYVTFTFGKNPTRPGFVINVSNKLHAEKQLEGIKMLPEQAVFMSNYIDQFLGWQALFEDDSVPLTQRKLFNKKLMCELKDYMTLQLEQIRIAKQTVNVATDLEKLSEVINVTNATFLSTQVPNNSRGRQSNDPVLNDLAQKEAESVAPSTVGYGDTNVAINPAAVVSKNDGTVPPMAAHFDPISAQPVQEPRERPSFTPSFGGFSDDLPF